MVDAGSHKPNLAEDEPGAKAILPEPRSVKKQMPISMKTRLLILGSLMTVSAVTPVHRALGQICTNCVTPPAGLVAWWTGDGDANDLVGTNHGVFVNGAVASVSGVVGVAFGLDGINDQIQVPNSPLLSFAPGSFMTIELWALRASPAGVMHLCGKRAGCGAINYQMAIDGGTPASAIPLNTWLHWAQVYDQAGLTVYTNGAVLTFIPGAQVGSQNADPFHIGTSGTCGGYWGGRIDEASIYNRALTVAEIRSIYLAGPAGKCKRFRILVPPEDQVIACGSNAMFSVVATNELGDLTYQWQFNGTNIADATARTLTLTNTTTGQAGIYTVIISNALGQCLSASAYLWFSFLDLHLYAGVTIRGSVGSGHRVEYAENLEPPIQWMSLTNIASLPFSPFIYIDYESAGKPKRFYRVVSDACP